MLEWKLNHDYHMVEMNSIPSEVTNWLKENMGDSKNGRWFIRYPNIYFHNESDHLLFLVKWS